MSKYSTITLLLIISLTVSLKVNSDLHVPAANSNKTNSVQPVPITGNTNSNGSNGSHRNATIDNQSNNHTTAKEEAKLNQKEKQGDKPTAKPVGPQPKTAAKPTANETKPTTKPQAPQTKTAAKPTAAQTIPAAKFEPKTAAKPTAAQTKPATKPGAPQSKPPGKPAANETKSSPKTQEGEKAPKSKTAPNSNNTSSNGKEQPKKNATKEIPKVNNSKQHPSNKSSNITASPKLLADVLNHYPIFRRYSLKNCTVENVTSNSLPQGDYYEFDYECDQVASVDVGGKQQLSTLRANQHVRVIDSDGKYKYCGGKKDACGEKKRQQNQEAKLKSEKKK